MLCLLPPCHLPPLLVLLPALPCALLPALAPAAAQRAIILDDANELRKWIYLARVITRFCVSHPLVVHEEVRASARGGGGVMDGWLGGWVVVG